MADYAVMIVDDEKIIRDGLQEAINWEQFGFTIAATASDGVEAINKFRAVRPDIIIMDIKMPEMDGLAALEQIKKENSDTEVVLLSGYEEFSYAKSGIRLGAFDYILKIKVFQELDAVLERLRKHLDEKRKQSSSLLQFQQLKNNYLFLRFIRGKMPTGITLSNQDTLYSVVSIWMDEEKHEASERMAQSIDGLQHVMGAESHYIHIILFQEGNHFKTHQQQISKGIEAIERCLKHEFHGTRYAMGIGAVKPTVAELPDSFREAMKTVDYLRCLKDGQAKMIYSEWVDAAPHTLDLNGTNEGWINWVYSGDAERLLAWLSDLFTQAYMAKDMTLKDMKTICIQVLLQFVSAMRSAKKSCNDDSNFFEELKDYDSLHELESYMIDHCKRLCELIHNNIQMQKNISITLVKEYIDQFYTSPLSLSGVAEHFHFSSGYLSLQFKEYTGKTFTQYIINKRLNRSCELLTGTTLQIYKIAAEVGYTDEKHFTKLFIRHFNMNPREYRMKHQAKNKNS